MSILSVMIPLIALTALLIFGSWILIMRMRSLRRGVSKEAKEALAIVHSEFDALQAQLQEQKKLLESSRKTKKLTKAESELIEGLSQSLDEAEKRMTKEVMDVEDIVE